MLDNNELVLNSDGLVPNNVGQVPNNFELVPKNNEQVPNNKNQFLILMLGSKNNKTSLIMIHKCIIETKQ